MMKKLISLLVIMGLAFSMFISFAYGSDEFSEGGWRYTVDNGEATILSHEGYGMDELSGDVVIPSTIGGYPVTKFNSIAYRSLVTNVVIPEGITAIGDGAFQGCTNLVSVTLPNTLTDITFAAFSGCTKLTNINIPDSITSIKGDAFNGCSSLVNITIPSSVNDIGTLAFKDCTKLTNVNIPDGIEIINNNLFEGCSSLTEIMIPDSVETIFSAAFKNSGLTDITIPDSVAVVYNEAFMIQGLQSIKFEGAGTLLIDDPTTVAGQAKIIGYSNSQARNYAMKYDRTFEDIETGEIYEPSDGGAESPNNNEESSAVITGNIQTAAITITAPLAVSFSIDPNNKVQPLVTNDLLLTNNSVAIVDVYVKSINSADMTILPATTYSVEDWKKLNAADSESKLALLLNGKDLANADNILLTTLRGNETQNLSLDVKHGLTFRTAKSCSVNVILSYSLK